MRHLSAKRKIRNMPPTSAGATLARPIAGFTLETQGRDLLQVEDALDDVRAVDDARAGVLVSR